MIKLVQQDIYDNNIHVQQYEPRVRSHISFTLASELVKNLLTVEDIPTRVKNMDKPVFDDDIDPNEKYEDITEINKKIRYLFIVKGQSPRDIMKEVGKTYTRVKNVIKKIKTNG